MDQDKGKGEESVGEGFQFPKKGTNCGRFESQLSREEMAGPVPTFPAVKPWRKGGC